MLIQLGQLARFHQDVLCNTCKCILHGECILHGVWYWLGLLVLWQAFLHHAISPHSRVYEQESKLVLYPLYRISVNVH